MTDSSLVSIIIPAYNAERHIKETLVSALGQSYSNLEIIVVDDGSTDRTVDVVRSIGDPRLHLHRKSQGGASSARNKALEIASGEYIQYLDADDILSLDKVSSAVRVLKESGPGTVSVSGVRYFHDGTPPQEGKLSAGWPFTNSDDPLSWLIDLLGGLGRAGMVQTSSWLIPRDIATIVGPWRESLTLDDDGEYFARVVLNCKRIRKAERGEVYYRKFTTGHNLSAGKKRYHLRSALRAAEYKATELISREDSERVRRALGRQFMGVAHQAYCTARDISVIAEKRAQCIGFTDYPLELGTRYGRVLRDLIGWKAALTMRHVYHNVVRYCRRT